LHTQKIKKKILALPANDRSFWSFATSVKENFCESSFPNLIKENSDDLVKNSVDKANLFAQKFCANTTLNDTQEYPPQIAESGKNISKIYFRTRAVFKILVKLTLINQLDQTVYQR